MNRRGFLKRGLLGGLILAGSGVGLSLIPGRSLSPKRALKCLSPREFSVMAAVADTVVVGPEVDAAEVAHQVDDWAFRVMPEARDDFVKLLRVLDNGLIAGLLGGVPVPFTRLSRESRERVLASWRDSSLVFRRAGYQSLRKISSGAHYRMASTWAVVGYPGPPDIKRPEDR